MRTIVAALILAMAASMPAFARARFYDSTPEEDAMLPRYCADAMLGPNGYGGPGQNPAAAHWIAVMGDGFWTIHHYCRALLLRMRSDKFDVPPQRRAFLRKEAVSDCDFVLKDTRPDFVLRPEILTRKGELLVQLHEYREAETAFQNATLAKQDYWPAYLGLASLYRSRGEIDRARSTVEVGLEHSPNSKSLARFLHELPTSSNAVTPAKPGGTR